MKNLIFSIMLASSVWAYGQQTGAVTSQWNPFCADGKVLIIPVAPGPAQTRQELNKIIALQSNASADSLLQKRLVFMHAGPPSFAWSRIADATPDAKQYWIRKYAYMHVAIYDALVAVSAVVPKTKRKAPYEMTPRIKKLTRTGETYQYPCPHSVAAGAASTILGHLYPEKKDSLMAVARDFALARITAGLQYPSDTEAGLLAGIEIAKQLINRADADGYSQLYTDTLPKGKEFYSGRPIRRNVHQMKTWILTSPGQFPSPPPPSMEEDMKLLRAFKRNDYGSFASFRWEYSWPWGEVLDQKVLEYHLETDPVEAAFTYALVAVSDYDNQVAHWNGKYTHFRARPDQYDTTFAPLFPTPPSPSYPAGHGTMAFTRATVLSYLFPHDRELFFQMAREANQSRFEAGVHFKSDNDAGEVLGRQIGNAVVSWAKNLRSPKPL